MTQADATPATGSGSASAEQDDPIERAAENWRRAGWTAGPHFLASLSVVAVEEAIRESNAEILEPHGLTHARHEALAVLYFSRRGELPLGVLSRQLMLHPTSITATVDALERLGYVERVPHPEDRRAVLAHITDAGREVMTSTCREMVARRSGMAALDEDEAAELFRLLRKVRRAAAPDDG
ncbi:MAG: MarR family transcriptional regulator [Actinomycetota bacterium]|nr:MarR family transcriptional regulator [Actinomycetota bacterium]